MEYSFTLEIEKPIGQVVKLFDNPNNLKEWQDGFVKIEHLSGNPGTTGAKSKITYKNGGHTIELTETIQVKNLPAEQVGLYEHKHGSNTMTNRFTSIDANKTKWEVVIGNVKSIGLMPKLMAMLMPGLFKKQTQKWLNQFKAFAEKN